MSNNVFTRNDINHIFDEEEQYEELIQNLKMYYPGLYFKAVDYDIKSCFELIILLNNGDYISYYDPTKSFRVIRYPTDMTEEKFKKEFGVRLRKIMKEECITQEELSEMTGISRIDINRYVNGKTVPSAFKLDLIARALNCSTDDFRFTFKKGE